MRFIPSISITALLCLTLSAKPAASFCFDEAGARYGVAPELIVALAQEETSMRSDVPPSWNTDGSYDVGLMRINSNWYHWSPHIREIWDSLEDPCTNVMAGTFILAGCIQQYGYNWKAVGCYHSRTPEKRDAYARRIAKRVLANQKAKPFQQQQKIASYTTAGKDDVARTP